MADIFLSYAREDRDRVMPLVQLLESTGRTVFWDRRIAGGQEWAKVLAGEIAACRCVLVVWSARSVDSSWVREEAEEGKRRQVLLPVRIDEVEPPFGFRGVQVVDLSEWDGQSSAASARQLESDLSRLLGAEPNLRSAEPAPAHNASSGPLAAVLSRYPLAASWVGRALFALLPLVYLVGDYVAFPAFLESRLSAGRVDVNALLDQRVASMGTFKAHEILVAIDSILSPSYLSYVRGGPNALVVSAYLAEDGSEATLGALAAALSRKLEEHAPEDARKLRGLLSQPQGMAAGDVSELDLHIPDKSYRRFPVDHVYVVWLTRRASAASAEPLSKGIHRILARSKDQGLSSLVIPCLGYNWLDKNSIGFDACLGPVFDGLAVSSSPRRVYLSLYTDWPTFSLEEAASAVNAKWASTFRSVYTSFPVPYRAEQRLPALFLCACLLLCLGQLRASWRNFATISVAYLLPALGLTQLIRVLAPEPGSGARVLGQIVVLVFLAIAVAAVVRANPRRLFERGAR